MKTPKRKTSPHLDISPGLKQIEIASLACELLAFVMADAPIKKLVAKYNRFGIGTVYKGVIKGSPIRGSGQTQKVPLSRF